MNPLRQRILVVEDDRATRDLIAACLRNAGFAVEAVGDGRGMQAAMQAQGFDLLLLDVNLPDSDGMVLANGLRRRSPMGIVIISERDSPEDRALGLELGADDYIAKPFFPREMLARVRNVLDRTAGAEARLGRGRMMRVGNWLLDRQARRVFNEISGADAELTGAEFDILCHFAAHTGQIFDRPAIAEQINGMRAEDAGRNIDILISRLRRKLGASVEAPIIETVRGHGYRLMALVDWV